MRQEPILFALLVSASWTAFSLEVKKANNVIVLGEANFTNTVMEKDTLLVEFYAPWCQYCKDLEPKFVAAAEQLKASGVSLAKVDATAEVALATRHGVKSYPTLKVFKRARPGEAFDYAGPTDSAGAIVAHMWTVAGPDWQPPPPPPSGLHRLTEANLTEALTRQEAWLVGFVDLTAAGGDDALVGLRAAAEELGAGSAVGYADAGGEEAAMAGRLGLTGEQLPAFVVLRRGQDWATSFSHELSAANLAKFYRAHGSQSASAVRSEASREFDSLDELDSIGEGLDALLLASSAARPEVRRFLAAFLAESGFFYERRLEGGLVSPRLAGRIGLVAADSVHVRLAPRLLADGESALAGYPGPLGSAPALKAFFDRHSLPRMGHFAWNTRRAYLGSGRPLCLFFMALGGWRGDTGRSARVKHAQLARMTAGRAGVLFAMADESVEAEEAGRFGFDDSSADVNLGCYDTARRRFAMPESDGPAEGDVRSFLDAFEAGVAPQRIRSAVVPLATGLVAEVNADRLGRLLAEAASGRPLLLLQCDFANQPCAHSLGEFAQAAAEAAASTEPSDSRRLGRVRFARLNTRYSDAPGDFYYRYEGAGAADMTDSQPQVLLALSAAGQPLRYTRDVVAKDYLLQFLTDSLPAAVTGKHEL